jgi:RimJ/RimL family protein N-acetyltransferase
MKTNLRRLGHSGAVSVRPLALGDYEAFSGLMGANAKRFADSGLALLPQTQASFASWIRADNPAASRQESLKVVFGAWVSVDGVERLAGFVGVETVHRFHGAGVWYGTDKALQGQGLTKTAVLLAMCDFAERAAAAGMKRPPRWVLHALPRNARSCGLAESIAFQRDETLDYMRYGGQRFHGFLLSRPVSQLRTEVSSRLAAAAMHATLVETEASNDARPSRRLRA